MHQYRITKYNPVFRDEEGRYTRNDWTEYSDVPSLVSREEYLRVESTYILAARHFLLEAHVPALTVSGLENNHENTTNLAEGLSLDAGDWDAAFRQILRDEVWCRFEHPTAFVHFGYDYYMYLGLPVPTPSSHAFALQQGLFVEHFTSPYHPEPNTPCS